MIAKKLLEVLLLLLFITVMVRSAIASNNLDEEVQEAIHLYNKRDNSPKPLYKAIEHLNTAISKDANDSHDLLNRAECFYTLNEKSKGLADCNRALAIDPNLVRGYIVRARFYSIMPNQDNAKAESDYNHAVNMQPDNFDLLSQRGWFYWSEGKYDLAIRDSGRAIEHRPSSELYEQRSRAYLCEREYEKAMADADKAIELNPKNGGAYLNRAGAYRALGRQKLADQDINMAHKLGFFEPD